MEDDKITSKEFLAALHRSYDKRLSFNNFIKRLRRDIALSHGYIMRVQLITIQLYST